MSAGMLRRETETSLLVRSKQEAKGLRGELLVAVGLVAQVLVVLGDL